jgi:hypothetical protein
MVVAELFFGRKIAGRAPLGASEWAAFAAQTIVPNFPDGFTVVDGAGHWRDPQTGRATDEESKILLVAVVPSADLARRLRAVIDTYRTQFREQSVGIITSDACAAFGEPPAAALWPTADPVR